MFAEEIRRAIMASSRTGLDALAQKVWAAYGANAVSEIEASELCELIAARRVQAVASTQPNWVRSGSRPRSSASLERRRTWVASGWLPPAIAARFTMGEAAALAVIVREIAVSGRCGLPMEGIAGRAGVCATTVRNALREARKLGILHVEERRVSYARSLPNVVTITSRELALWVRTRARVDREGGGCRTAMTTTNLHIPSRERPRQAAPTKGFRQGWRSDRIGAPQMGNLGRRL